MNTIEKGDKLEDKVFELFKEDISNNRFWARKECCEIYKKKGYYIPEDNVLYTVRDEEIRDYLFNKYLEQ